MAFHFSEEATRECSRQPRITEFSHMIITLLDRVESTAQQDCLVDMSPSLVPANMCGIAPSFMINTQLRTSWAMRHKAAQQYYARRVDIAGCGRQISDEHTTVIAQGIEARRVSIEKSGKPGKFAITACLELFVRY